MSTVTLRLISDFNAEPLARYLNNAQTAEGMAVEVTPYGQVYQSLDAVLESRWGRIVWTLPERIVPTFAQALNFEEIDPERCLEEVDTFADALLSSSGTYKHNFIVNWALPQHHRGYGMLDWRPGLGIANVLAGMNLHLARRLSESDSFYLLDTGRWLRGAPDSASHKMWYAAKVPFMNQVFERAAADVIAAIDGIFGRSRRVIVLDLDNTLWGGVVGETGWEGIRLGGHDHVGEAYCDFQRELKAMSNRGIQLAIVSKNDESVALEAIDRHSGMILKRDHFSGWRINWNDKAANVVSLLEELNLGLGSVVFIDDNPAERERIRGALPDVLVPDWPVDPAAYVSALRALDCFDIPSISAEDRGRTAMYVAERERRETKNDLASLDDWLQRLDTRLRVSRIDRSNIARVAQLFNKTNQLNLSTRRLSEQEIMAWAAVPTHSLMVFSAMDRFGDMGLVGVVGVEANGVEGQLTDFMLSCRVMGRKVEEAMIHLAVSELSRMGARRLVARYLPTKRNRPTLDVLRSVGLEEEKGNVFAFDCTRGFAKPESVTIEFSGELAGSHA